MSAIMIAAALGARVVAIDINNDVLELASSLGAAATVNASEETMVVEAVRSVSDGGAHLSVDALGSQQTCTQSIQCLRKRGRHVQIGLMAGNDRHPAIPMELLIANELELVGSHGMQAHQYGRMLQMISDGKLEPQRLIGGTVSLEAAIERFTEDAGFPGPGVSIITFGDTD